MRIFALELNNDIKGLKERKEYIEYLIRRLERPDLIVLPELALCSYMASKEIWKYVDDEGKDTLKWALSMAVKYHAYIAVGYLDKENGDYYNRYMIVSPDGLLGTVTKSEGEAAVFKRGYFPNIIKTPFGNVGVGICFDSRRKHFYDSIKDEEISLILFPHGAPADPGKPEIEKAENEERCMKYVKAFNVPVVYVNYVGSLEYMPGMMGAMMKKAGFRMNGYSKIYSLTGEAIDTGIPEAVGIEAELKAQRRKEDISFYGEDILNTNILFKHTVLPIDTRYGERLYEKYKKEDEYPL